MRTKIVRVIRIEVNSMHMKTGVEQSVYAILLLNMLPEKAVLPGEAISQQLNVSTSYFQKLLRKLVSADLIASVPGVKGGFKLKKKPEDICVYDIYLAIEGRQSLYSLWSRRWTASVKNIASCCRRSLIGCALVAARAGSPAPVRRSS
jgi:Rrf2 family protein